MKIKQYSDGAHLFWQQQPADRLFLIVQGAVEVLFHVSDEAEIRVAILQEGESLGEMALIDDAPRMASARAIEPVTVLWLSQDDLHELRHQHQELFITLVLNVARQISERLSACDKAGHSAVFGIREG